MKNYGVFDIMGPMMVGPSSSHTAGAARLGGMARRLCGGEISDVTFYLHGSFASTYHGHGTDKALLAGILGIGPADYRLRDSFQIAKEKGLEFRFISADLGDVHPNTVKFKIALKDGRRFSIMGSSIGGGSIVITDINGIEVYFTGEKPILVTCHLDELGVVSRITTLLYREAINIGNMRVQRTQDSSMASMYVELDGEVDFSLADKVRKIPGIENVILLNEQFD